MPVSEHRDCRRHPLPARASQRRWPDLSSDPPVQGIPDGLHPRPPDGASRISSAMPATRSHAGRRWPRCRAPSKPSKSRPNASSGAGHQPSATPARHLPGHPRQGARLPKRPHLHNHDRLDRRAPRRIPQNHLRRRGAGKDGSLLARVGHRRNKDPQLCHRRHEDSDMSGFSPSPTGQWTIKLPPWNWMAARAAGLELGRGEASPP